MQRWHVIIDSVYNKPIIVCFKQAYVRTPTFSKFEQSLITGNTLFAEFNAQEGMVIIEVPESGATVQGLLGLQKLKETPLN